MKREEYLKMIRNNEAIKSILDNAKSDAERKAIRAHAEDMLLGMFDGFLGPIYEQLEKDPDVMEKSWREFEKELLNNNKKSG